MGFKRLGLKELICLPAFATADAILTYQGCCTPFLKLALKTFYTNFRRAGAGIGIEEQESHGQHHTAVESVHTFYSSLC